MEIKIYLKSFLSFTITLIFLLLLTTILYYFDLINYNTTKYFKIVTIIISSFISGYIRGYNSINKGYINGLDKQLEVVKNNVISKIDSRINELNKKLEVLDREDKEYHEQEVNDSMESEE